MTIGFQTCHAPRPAHFAGLVFVIALLVATHSAFAAPTARECATASEDGLSLRKHEKLGAARDRFLVCADATCPAEIREECSRRVTEVAEALPSIVFDVKDAAGNDASQVRVSMDGALLVDRLGATALSIDPGEHTFRFEAEQTQPVEKRFVIRDGEKNRHLAVTLGASGVSAATVATGSPSWGSPLSSSAPASSAPQTAEQPSTSSWSAQRTGALVAGGVGVVSIVVGAVFGLDAFSKWSHAQSACGNGCGPNDPAQGYKKDASTAATVSTVAFVVSGIAVVGAVVLWATAPSGGVQVAPTVGPQAGGVTIRGMFR
jgi:hypothetical protein